MHDRVQAHDSRRCPECTTIGRVVELDTRSEDASADLDRVRARTLECRDEDCNEFWKYFG